jgi:cytochrome P450
MATQSVHELDLPLFEETCFNVGVDEERNAVIDTVEGFREHHWLARTELGFVVLRHDDAFAVLRDRRFHNALAQRHGEEGTEENPAPKSILVMEGDEHTRLRRLVSPAFSPKAAERLRPFMRDVGNELFDAVSATGRCELVRDICEPYPIPVICELLGAPKQDWKLFSQWAEDIFKRFNADSSADGEAIMRAFNEVHAYVNVLIEERRATPQQDLLSELIAVEEQGDRLSTDELLMLAQAILLAGTDTTRNQLACCVGVLVQHPEQWALLAEHPELAAQAVEECLRVNVSVRGVTRFASEDIEYKGVLFPKGTIVGTNTVAADTDADRWEAPEKFDITKKRDAQNLAFGSGFHFCLGASLARAELQEALTLLTRRMPDATLDGPILWKPPTTGIWGPAAVPLRFTPSPALAS